MTIHYAITQKTSYNIEIRLQYKKVKKKKRSTGRKIKIKTLRQGKEKRNKLSNSDKNITTKMGEQAIGATKKCHPPPLSKVGGCGGSSDVTNHPHPSPFAVFNSYQKATPKTGPLVCGLEPLSPI